MEKIDNSVAVAEESIERVLGQFADIDGLPEVTAAEVRKKWNACNQAVFKLGDILPTIHSESGSDTLDDQGSEDAEDIRGRGLAAQTMAHFRDEMVRLGDKLEVLESKAA